MKSFDNKKLIYNWYPLTICDVIENECIINKRRNPYVKFSNYEHLFKSLLSKKYKQIASGRDKLHIGKFAIMSKKSLYKDILWKAV